MVDGAKEQVDSLLPRNLGERYLVLGGLPCQAAGPWRLTRL